MAAPQISAEQRAKALEQARETRAKRAKMMEDLRSGKLKHAKALEKASDDPVLGRIKVASFLQTISGVGKAKAEKIMDECGIAANRRLAGVGKRQAELLQKHFA